MVDVQKFGTLGACQRGGGGGWYVQIRLTPTRQGDRMCQAWQTDTPRTLYGKKNSKTTDGV